MAGRSISERLPPIALTMGDPAGIGGELTLKAWLARRHTGPVFVALDDPDRLRALARALDLPVRIAAQGDPAGFPDALPVHPVPLAVPALPGQPDAANAPAVIRSIETAVRMTLAGQARAIVTNPINKAALYGAGFGYPGHTEFLAALTGSSGQQEMMLAIPGLRVVPVTVHQSLRSAIAALTPARILAAARTTAAALRRDFAIPHPRLAIAGLNPHAGEDGALGREERDLIAPAIATLIAEGERVSGPWPPDTMFTAKARARYDAAICMYHDQALIPLKTLDIDRGVNITLGLPIVRTSPDHGTAFDIAGKGVANPASLLAALDLAGSLSERR
ncbi:MAG: 4-hydroxythreonine-4-phosphate dehydrogenase PdxA [Acetobacteraceae bacterium]